MKKLLVYLFFLCLILFLGGCLENLVENTYPNINRIKKVFVSEDNFTEYFYDSKLLVKKVSTLRGEIIYSITFTYDEKDRLIRKDDFSTAAGILLSTYSTYEYDVNNVLIKTNSFIKTQDSSYKYSGYIIYEYENNRLTKYSYYDLSNELRSHHTLKYNNNNVIEDSQYDRNDNLQIIETFEYDNKLNPLNKDASFISAFTVSTNNITKWITTYHTVNPPNIDISESSYTYNHYGYPVKCITVYSRNENGIISQNTTTSHYEYY